MERRKNKTREPILSSYIEVRNYLSLSFVDHDDRCDFGAFVRAIEIDRLFVCFFFWNPQSFERERDWLTARDGGQGEEVEVRE